jgi:hypothetical protein
VINIHSEPGLPEEYLQFLEQLGYGCFDGLSIYSGPMPPRETYPNFQSDPLNVMLIGDDMQGYCFGFDKSREFTLVEVDPLGVPDDIAQPDFLAFVAAHLRNQE